MKLSVSNIAWGSESDEKIYGKMRKLGFAGLEIAPTRIFGTDPYRDLARAVSWALRLKEEYGFQVSSMQSIWYGRTEKLFGEESERRALLAYTRAAIDFAAAVGCGNLVFGCPKNRLLPEGADPETAVSFFRELGDYAARKGTVLAMEANPTIYGTNYVNYTEQALKLIGEVASEGFRLNLDVGTMVQNEESVSILKGKIGLVNHVHVSEPYLAPVRRRALHEELAALLREEGYDRFVSIEMGMRDDTGEIEDVMAYLAGIFGED